MLTNTDLSMFQARTVLQTRTSALRTMMWILNLRWKLGLKMAQVLREEWRVWQLSLLCPLLTWSWVSHQCLEVEECGARLVWQPAPDLDPSWASGCSSQRTMNSPGRWELSEFSYFAIFEFLHSRVWHFTQGRLIQFHCVLVKNSGTVV